MNLFRTSYVGKPSSLTLYKTSSHPIMKIAQKIGPRTLLGSTSGSNSQENLRALNEPKRPFGMSLPSHSLSSSPISDLHAPTASLLKLDVFRDLSPIIIDDIPPLPLIESHNFEAIFEKKLEACSQICPFANEEKEKISIDRKTRYLTEIYRLFIGSSPQSGKMTDVQFEKVYQMVMKNIVRRLPNLGETTMLNEDVSPFEEPSWTHLSIVYQILTKIFYEFPDAKFFDFSTIQKLMKVSGTGDSRERTQISIFVSRFISVRGEYLNDIIALFSSIVAAYLDHQNSPHSVLTVITIFNFIIKDLHEAKHGFTTFLRKLLIPLMADSNFPFFQSQLVEIYHFFIDENTRNTGYIGRLIVNKWPKQNTCKQVVFLSLLMKCIPKMHSKDLHEILPKALSIIAKATDSDCSKVAEAAFSMWTTLGFEKIINDNLPLIFKYFPKHVLNARNYHWYQTVRNNANFAISVLMKRDPKTMQNEARAAQEVDESKLFENEIRSWILIAHEASKNDDGIDLSKKLGEIYVLYTPKTPSKPKNPIPRLPRPRSQTMNIQTIVRPLIHPNYV